MSDTEEGLGGGGGRAGTWRTPPVTLPGADEAQRAHGLRSSTLSPTVSLPPLEHTSSQQLQLLTAAVEPGFLK